MYTYFSELDCPDKFKLYLKKNSCRNEYKTVYNVHLEDTFFHKYRNVFQMLSFLDLLSQGLYEELSFTSPYLSKDEYLNLCDFFQYKETCNQETPTFFLTAMIYTIC